MDLDAIEEDTFLNVEPEVDEASKSTHKATQLRPTLLSTISELITSFDEKYPTMPAPSNLHGFSPKPPDTEILESILHASGVIATTLASHIPSGDERYELRSREYTSHADAWFQPQTRVRDIFRLIFSERRLYGTDPPLDRAMLPGWIIEQIERYVKAAGMDVFPDSDEDGRTTLACAGKIIVMDIALFQEVRYPTRGPDEIVAPLPEAILELKELKISRASVGGDTTAPSTRHPPIERLLHGSLSRFILEALKEETDPLRLREAGETFRDQVAPLLTLDRLAHAEAGGVGERWFKEGDVIEGIGMDLATREAESVAGELGVPKAPLDIFINRSHGIPLTSLYSPSTAYLIHMSPRAYLSVSRIGVDQEEDLPPHLTAYFDVPLKTLRAYLTESTAARGLVTLATLTLSTSPDSASSTNHLLSLLPPDFSLLPSSTLSEDQLNHVFPLSTTTATPPSPINATSSSNVPPTEPDSPSTPVTRGFVLDFGKSGIVMRRQAMSRLAWVQDAGGMLGMDSEESNGTMMEGGGAYDAYAAPAWMDLLVNPKAKIRSQRYESYSTRTTDRPPLHHFLAPSGEAGFVLGQIRVSKMSDVWRIVEVVKEQAWLNDTLRGFYWMSNKLASTSPSGMGEAALTGSSVDDMAYPLNEDDLESFLHNVQTPKEITVQVSVQATCPNPSIHLTVPLPRLGLPLLSFSVTYDPTAKRGVRVDLPELEVGWKDDMEEIVRRGGISTLAGWVWKKAGEPQLAA
ncbi:hypothetical protein FRB96_003737 [Tulasnella sp. 330]|nr:hypothetical protein FRB96_003737 [Tulasnella sp. 330]